MVLNENIYRCPSCQGTKARYRYKLTVNAIDVEPADKNNPVFGQFTFLSDCGAVLTGIDSTLLAPATKGRPNFVPSTIVGAVGKKCTVIAEVKQDTLHDENGLIILTVSKAQLINAPAPTEPSSSHSNPGAADKVPLPIGPSEESQSQPKDGRNPLATPVKDVIEEANANTTENTTSAVDDKKRKNTTSDKKSAKKSASNEKDGPGKEIFPRGKKA